MKKNFLVVWAYLFLTACVSSQTVQTSKSTNQTTDQSSSLLLEAKSQSTDEPRFCTVAEVEDYANRLPATANQCIDLFKSSKPEITDINSFGKAMTEGMLLNPNQADLFEVYRKLFFGDPNTNVGKDLKNVLVELQKHPELIKPHFLEYEITSVEKVYDTPEALTKYLKSQVQTAGEVRNNLFQIESNLGFWKKVLDYKDPEVPAQLSEMQKKLGKDSSQADKEAYRKAKQEFESQSKKRFETYLNRVINKSNRDLLATLKDDHQEYLQKSKALFQTLKYLQEWMDKKGRNSQSIRQAMVDLVNTTGYGNQATQALLKSKNALEKVEGLQKILDEADSAAQGLGYKNLSDLQQKLRIEFPTGLTKNENAQNSIENLKQQVLTGKVVARPTDTVRVRSLSIQEAPFRSCLGGSDCSSRTYFSKALDPNFNYFTMTDQNNHSSGHVTIVLGEALNPTTNRKEKVGFIDKLQNVPNNKIQIFLQAVAKSLQDQGYKLAVPKNVGDHNGLSNVDTTRHFVDQEVLPKLIQELKSFEPLQHQYNFQNTYSRAYGKLDVKIFEPTQFDTNLQTQNVEIKLGKSYAPEKAKTDLDKDQLINAFLDLKNSNQESDLLKYISIGPFVEQLQGLGLYKMDQYKDDLTKILKRPEVSFQVKKAAAFELLLLNDQNVQANQNIQGKSTLLDFSQFNDNEKMQMISEIRQWGKSNNERRKKFYNELGLKWEKSLTNGDIATITSLVELKLFDLNTKNESGFLPLVIAGHANQKQLVEWMLKNPNLNLSQKDEFGHSITDQLRLSGKREMADYIEQKRPDLKSEKKIETKERTDIKTAKYPMGMPIVDFVEIRPGKFRMGDEKVLVTLTKSFQMMSTHTTQKQWKSVLELAKAHLQEVPNLNSDPSKFKSDMNPVEQVSYDDIALWNKGLNQLSQLDHPDVQRKLKELFPGHQRNHQYRLPTEAEYEYVLKQMGLSNTEYIHGNAEEGLTDYAIYSKNSGNRSQPVGKEKPIYINGKPIYGVVGNVWHWLLDWYGNLEGSVDPRGPANGSGRVIRGGGWGNDADNLRSGARGNWGPGARSNGVGFRLLRTSP